MATDINGGEAGDWGAFAGRRIFDRSLTPKSGGEGGDKGMAGEILEIADMRGVAAPTRHVARPA